MCDENVNADTNTSTLLAAVQLAQPPPTNPSRVSRQAIEALAQLALQSPAVVPTLLRIEGADPSVPGGMRPAVLEALLSMRRAGASVILTYYAKQASVWLAEDGLI